MVLRQPVKSSLVAQTSRKSRQPELQFLDPSETTKVWEYAVLVTNADYSLEAMGQLYRDRADCENGFDELKNQWGWGGYTTQDLERCNLSARAVALIYNWWSWYVRLAQARTRPGVVGQEHLAPHRADREPLQESRHGEDRAHPNPLHRAVQHQFHLPHRQGFEYRGIDPAAVLALASSAFRFWFRRKKQGGIAAHLSDDPKFLC